MLHCRVASQCLSRDPGAVSFANKSLTGATDSGLTGSQITIAEGKNCNTYTSAGYGPLTKQGEMVSGISIEAVRDSFYAANSLELALYNLLTTRAKTPFNESGRQLLLSTGNGVVQRMISEGVFDPDADEVNQFIVPEIADLDPDDVAARNYADCQLVATHLSSMVKVTITADVSVS